MQYDWIDFYTEFATKLLPFKTDRKTLIQKIYAVYDAAGISVPRLESGDEIIDIDPFTIFGTFNKGITNANKIAILIEKQVILIICGDCLKLLLYLPIMTQQITAGNFLTFMIWYMISFAFAGILRWACIGFVLIHLSTWIPEIAGL